LKFEIEILKLQDSITKQNLQKPFVTHYNFMLPEATASGFAAESVTTSVLHTHHRIKKSHHNQN
jgi:hypothetical protein